MFGFGSKNPDFLYVAVLDIASGSVGTAIYEFPIANQAAPPTVLFQNRILLTAQGTTDADTPSLRSVKEALLTSLLELNSNGLKELHVAAPGAQISQVTVSISAPWAHIVPRDISYSDDEIFTVTESLIDELKASAEDQAEHMLSESDVASSQNLRVISRQVTSITANGYALAHPGVGAETPELTISMSSCFVREDILTVVDEVIEKMFPHTELRYASFMQAFHHHLRTAQPKQANALLLDLTGEATEAALITDQTLRAVTFIPQGVHTTARYIAETEGVPVNEALTYLKNLDELIAEHSQSTSARAAVVYQQSLTQLFTRLLSTEAIPASVYVTSNEPVGGFFIHTLTQTLASIDHTKHTIRPIIEKLLPPVAGEVSPDIRLAIIAHFFHNS